MNGVSSNGSSWPARRVTWAPFQSAVASRWSDWRVMRALTVELRADRLDIDANERAGGALGAIKRRAHRAQLDIDLAPAAAELCAQLVVVGMRSRERRDHFPAQARG